MTARQARKALKLFKRKRVDPGIAPDDPTSAERARTRASFVKKWIPRDGIGAEIGVFKGHFSKVLLDHAQPRQLHLIDPWYMLSPTWGWGDGNNSTVDALINILRYFKPEIEAEIVVVHVGDDLEVLERFEDHSLDWVYLDSTHEYDHTLEELALLARKVKPEGVIAGDDWRPDPESKHHGLYRAVQEFMAVEPYEVIHAGRYGQWAIRRIMA